MSDGKEYELAFRPRARLVSILGEHLISDHAVGLIELVKNSYDADATEVIVKIADTGDAERTRVTIRDNGCGMTLEDIRLKWLSPAADHKERDKRENRRTALGRLPIGEKGVGRFAVHQLGRQLEMVTRASDQPEIALSVDWDAFDQGENYLDGLRVQVVERGPQTFPENRTGTEITVTRTRLPWSEKLLKKVHRTLRRLQSPLMEEEHRFRVRLICPEFPELENIDPTDILPKAHYEFRALVDERGRCDLEYTCKHPAVARREEAESVDLVSLARDEMQGESPRCGPFYINLYVWDRTKDHLQESQVSKRELDALCGVSLFRDGLRILPYGEPGDDWLLLDQERIQAPADRIGNNQVIGLVQFDQSSNLLLRDKTNREGLIENEAFLDMRALVRAAIRQFTKYWKNDRPEGGRKRPRRIDGDIEGARVIATAVRETAREDIEVSVPSEIIAGGESGSESADVQPELQTVSQRRAVELIIEHINGTEESIRERDSKSEMFLHLAGTGLAAERVVHEFGRNVAAAAEAMKVIERVLRGDEQAHASLRALQASLETLKSEFRVLAPYEMTGRAQKARKISTREYAELAIELNRVHLSAGQIEACVEGANFTSKVKPTPLLQILDNLVHNACSWVPTVQEGQLRRVAIVLSAETSRILVVDSGPGVDREAESHIFDPFFTMKAGGKGLGLYISSELAGSIGGSLRLAGADEEDLVPDWACGAAFVLDLDRACIVPEDGSEGDVDG